MPAAFQSRHATVGRRKYTSRLGEGPRERGLELGNGGPRGRTGGPDVGLDACPRRGAGHRVRGRWDGRRDREDGRVRRLPVRPRRPSLLHQARAGAAALGGDARLRASDPPAAVADLLPRPLLQLPAAGTGRLPRPRRGRVRDERLLVPLLAPQAPAGAPGDVRGLGRQPVRPPPVRRLLSLLHREGLGHPRLRDPGRVGGPEDPGVQLLARDLQHPRDEAGGASDADRGVPLPAARPRADVGGVRRCRCRSRDPGAPQPSLHRDQPQRRAGRQRRRADERPRQRAPGRRGAFQHAARGVDRVPRPPAPPTTCARRRRAFAIATSASSP